MKRFLFLLVVFVFAANAASAQIVNEIIKRIDTHSKTLKSVECSLTITRFSAETGSFTKEGRIKFLSLRDDYSLRFDAAKPVAESLSIFDRQYTLYTPNTLTAYTGAVTAAQTNVFAIFALLPNFSTKRLKSEFGIRYIGEEKSGGATAWHLELTPKAARDNYKTIELWIDRDGMPIGSKTNENGGDSTTVVLADIKKNLTLTAADFKLKLPKNVRTVKAAPPKKK
ncbi:MAG: outer membrane lipoprotein carrier protein LolA [Acidobacteria bacterium]|nr:outer membrane lipoprotein carrier protein LolA [Acidobacteriota bacterium]